MISMKTRIITGVNIMSVAAPVGSADLASDHI